MLYLKNKDKKLGEVIDALGRIDRPVNLDVFAFTVESLFDNLFLKRLMKRYGKKWLLN